MSEIKAGDLVMVVRGHECVQAVIGGIPFVVSEICQSIYGGVWCCKRCLARDIPASEQYAPTTLNGTRVDVPLSWLLRIDPPAQDETSETREELTA